MSPIQVAALCCDGLPALSPELGRVLERRIDAENETDTRGVNRNDMELHAVRGFDFGGIGFGFGFGEHWFNTVSDTFGQFNHY